MYSIDSILINFLKRIGENPLLPYNSKIALIGEESPRGTEGSLKYRLKQLGYKNIKIFWRVGNLFLLMLVTLMY